MPSLECISRHEDDTGVYFFGYHQDDYTSGEDSSESDYDDGELDLAAWLHHEEYADCHNYEDDEEQWYETNQQTTPKKEKRHRGILKAKSEACVLQPKRHSHHQSRKERRKSFDKSRKTRSRSLERFQDPQDSKLKPGIFARRLSFSRRPSIEKVEQKNNEPKVGVLGRFFAHHARHKSDSHRKGRNRSHKMEDADVSDLLSLYDKDAKLTKKQQAALEQLYADFQAGEYD